jgi:valyl-tRNA synthetase
VGALRNARAEYGVELGRRIPARLLVADAELRDALREEVAILCLLAKLDPAQARCLESSRRQG